MEKILKEKMKLDFQYSEYAFSPPTAYLFGALFNHFDKTQLTLWFISNFMNPCIDINLEDPDLPNTPLVYVEFFRQNMWYDCPFIEDIDFSLEYVRNKWEKNFSDLALEALEMGYFVYADINRKYIPHYKSQFDFTHNLLLLGFDKKTKEFDIADYFYKRKFSIEKCSFEELNQAFYQLKRIWDCDRFSKVNIFKYKENENYQFNVSEIVSKTKDYLYGTDLIQKHYYALFAFQYNNSGKLYYGIDYYKALKILIRDEREMSTKLIQILYVHKLIMKKRLEILQEKKILENQCIIADNDILMKKTLVLRNLILKITIRDDQERIHNMVDRERVLNLINELEDLDYRFHSKLLAMLSEG